MQVRAQKETLGTCHGQGEAMDMEHRLLIMIIQVRLYCCKCCNFTNITGELDIYRLLLYNHKKKKKSFTYLVITS